MVGFEPTSCHSDIDKGSKAIFYLCDRSHLSLLLEVFLKDLFEEATLLNVSSMTLAELKKQVECQFEIPVNAQKWILDKTLANNDESTLASYGINKKNQNIYLYLITPGKVGFVLLLE
jgi:hypothetical protein